MPKRGRPTSLTPELAEQLVGLLRVGNHVSVACEAVGIHPNTYRCWLKRGLSEEMEDAPFRELRERVEAARAEAEARAVATVMKAAATDWRAAAWLLERGYPERWSRPAERRAPQEEAAQAQAQEPEEENPFAEVLELAARRRQQHA